MNINDYINTTAREIDKEGIVYTIEELYIWAKAHGYENFSLAATYEGLPCNVIISEMEIDKNEKRITL